MSPQGRRSAGVVEQAVEEVGGGSVLLGKKMAVDRHRDVRVGVPQASGDGARVDAGTEQLCRDVSARTGWTVVSFEPE